MDVSSIGSRSTDLLRQVANTSIDANAAVKQDGKDLKTWFDRAIGETFFSQLIAQMRKTVSKPAYFHGGRGEEVFQGQLDQLLTERMTEASAEDFTGPMFELFQLRGKYAAESREMDQLQTKIDGTQNVNTELDNLLTLTRR